MEHTHTHTLNDKKYIKHKNKVETNNYIFTYVIRVNYRIWLCHRW